MRKFITRSLLTLAESVFVTGIILYMQYIYHNQGMNLADFMDRRSEEMPLIWGISFLSVLFVKYILFKFKKWRILHVSLRRIDRMEGEVFEKFLKAHFEHMGYRVELTEASNDYGADLLLYKKKTILAVQAKRYSSNIGVKAVQEVMASVAYYGADRGMVVTNSYFTSNAKNLAEANEVILWDRDMLVRMMAGDETISCM